MQRWHFADGLTVVADPVPGAQVAAAGVFVAGGSRLDPPGQSGLAHFLEHAVFRGTELRDGRAISRELDRRGASINGFTDKEMTWFEAEALAPDLPYILDLLGELVLKPRLEPDAAEKERRVVLAEADEADEDGEEQVLDLLEKALWPGSPAGRPVVGLPDEVRALSVDALRTQHDLTYRPDRMVIALAGGLPDDLASFLAFHVSGQAWARRGPIGPLAMWPQDGEVSRIERSPRDLGQVHLAIGHRAPGRNAANQAAAHLLAELLGGGPSSRLFERLREDEGLVYTVYAQSVQYVNRGYLSAYLSCGEEDLGKAVTALRREIRRLGEDGVTEEEVERARGSLRGSLAFAEETASGRMARLGDEELLGGGGLTPEKRLARLEQVTAADVKVLAEALGRDADGWAWTVVGPVEPDWRPSES